MSKAAQIEEAAKLELFERQNIAGASDRATEQAKAAVEQSKEELRAPSQGEASGFTVKVNEKRAKETKVRSCHQNLCSKHSRKHPPTFYSSLNNIVHAVILAAAAHSKLELDGH